MPPRNYIVTDAGAVVVANAATALPFPPVVSGFPTGWTSAGNNTCVPEFDLEIWANATVNLTLARLYGGISQPLVVADFTFTAATTDIVTATAHGLETGDGPLFGTSSGTLPAGLTLATGYYAIKIDANTFYVATSRQNALAGTRVDITGTGSGTHTFADDSTTERVHWHSLGLLGDAQDGAIGLTLAQGYMLRCRHHPRVIAYAVSATLSAANATTVSIYPIQSVQ